MEYIETMIEYIKSWENVPFGECEKCDFGKFIKDQFGTGDSPNKWDCSAGNIKCCEYLNQYVIDTAELKNVVMQDVDVHNAPKFTDAWIESATYLGKELNNETLEWLNLKRKVVIGFAIKSLNKKL